MDMNWKSLAAMLPVQPCDELKRDVLMGIYDMHDLGGDLILYHQESVGLADEIGQIMDPQDWAHWEQSKKRRWGARCTCTSCGEDFIAGYVKNGIVLAEGPDGQTYDGYAEQGPDSSVYLDGDEAVCPHCWTAATITGFEGYGKFWKAYAYPPAHIDREAWTAEWIKYDGYTECSKCKHWYDSPESEDDGDRPAFCPSCGRAMTPEAWAELEKRMGVVR